MSTFSKLAQSLVLWAFDDYVAGMYLFTSDMGGSYFLDHMPSGGIRMTHYETLEELIAAVQDLTSASKSEIMTSIAFECVDELKQFVDKAVRARSYDMTPLQRANYMSHLSFSGYLQQGITTAEEFSDIVRQYDYTIISPVDAVELPDMHITSLQLGERFDMAVTFTRRRYIYTARVRYWESGALFVTALKWSEVKR